MFCLYTSSKLSAQNLNFHWKWRWLDRIQTIFLNIFYFTYKLMFAIHIIITGRKEDQIFWRLDFVHHNCFSLYILLVERWEIIDILGCLKKLRWGHVSGRACPPFFGGRFWPRALRSEERGHVWHFCMFFRPFWAFYKLGSRSTLHFAVKSKVCELKREQSFIC